MRQVGQEIENDGDVQMLKLLNFEAKYFVTGRVQFFLEFIGGPFGIKFFKKTFNVLLNVSLFVTVTVLFFLDVLHVLLFLALLLPVELVIYVTCRRCHVQLRLHLLNDSLFNIIVCYIVHFGVESEVFGDNTGSYLY